MAPLVKGPTRFRQKDHQRGKPCLKGRVDAATFLVWRHQFWKSGKAGRAERRPPKTGAIVVKPGWNVKDNSVGGLLSIQIIPSKRRFPLAPRFSWWSGLPLGGASDYASAREMAPAPLVVLPARTIEQNQLVKPVIQETNPAQKIKTGFTKHKRFRVEPIRDGPNQFIE